MLRLQKSISLSRDVSTWRYHDYWHWLTIFEASTVSEPQNATAPAEPAAPVAPSTPAPTASSAQSPAPPSIPTTTKVTKVTKIMLKVKKVKGSADKYPAAAASGEKAGKNRPKIYRNPRNLPHGAVSSSFISM